MYTTRGYRQSSRENKKHSRQGQIIQKKPVFQIDNNQVVLDAYRKFFLAEIPKNMLKSDRFLESFYCNLSTYQLTWTSSTSISNILQKFIDFAGFIFDQFTALGRYAISLECYSPDLDDDNSWMVCRNQTTNRITSVYRSIILDRLGNCTFKQNGSGYLLQSSGTASWSATNLTLGYGEQALVSPLQITLGNPTQMKVDIYYYRYFNRN